MDDEIRIAERAEIIRENYSRVVERICQAAADVKRNPDDIRLVVVTKTQPVQVIQAAIDAGAKIFGENYAEQAELKIDALKDVCDIEWHMIGHVQSRKSRLVVENFDMVHSVDSVKLAKKMNQVGAEIGKKVPVLLEFNLGDEPNKSGWLAGDPDLWRGIVSDIEQIFYLSNIQVRGLMTMPPLFDNPERVRPFFRKLKDLQEVLIHELPEGNWYELSMGTSGDFEIAVQEGATLLRVGQAILGPRPKR